MNKIDPLAQISPLADIETSVRGSKLTVGAHSVIDSFVKIKFVGGSGDIHIGNHCFINSGCVLYSGNGIQLANNVLIGANCTFAPVNHQFKEKHTLIREQGFAPSKGGIVIEDDVWVGVNVVILDGSVIPKGCIIGAGSVVRSHLEPFGVYAGNPLTLVRMR